LKCGSYGVLENFLQVLAGQSGALDEFGRSDFFGHFLTVSRGYLKI
jgi:hypothetical protein